MSEQIAARPALEQLRELIAILRQLSNAGPRDKSFKQWRQVTLTLLQRVWASDQTRAVRFRRIPFSGSSSKSDAKADRESFVLGVNEATAYLESLAQELESVIKPNRTLVRPPEVTAPVPPPEPQPPLERPSETYATVPPPETRRPLVRPPEATAAAPPPAPRRPLVRPPEATAAAQRNEPLEPSPWQAGPPAGHAEPGPGGTAADPPSALSPPHAARKQAAPASPGAGGAGKGSRQRLKDMLGFSDDGAASAGEAEATPTAPLASSHPSTFAAPPRPAPNAPSAGPPTPVSPSPAWVVQDERRPPPPSRVPTPAAPAPDQDSDDLEYDLESILADDAEPDGVPAPATLREMLDRELPPRAAPTRAARDVLSMAEMVDRLGVPPQRQAIVRAALIDLGEQMDAPPVQWVALRQVLNLVMDYPQIARRVIPKLLPYLDEAA